ncbi:hypothetical protein PBY51_006111 [Eleginops maclovinus]|uniref:Uncharacterized protein n=1 Tax=Eleginops maclovinus TaxID=56733 RepID=A0AAN8A0Z8_ELEMC|nr:hypothetical protein PBY51_006111 [Eleginops maclovinus]
MNLLSVTEKSSSGVSGSSSLLWPLLCALPRSLFSWHRVGLGHRCGQKRSSQRRVSGYFLLPPLFICPLFRNSLSFTLTHQLPPLYSSCVTVQFPSVYLPLAGIILTRCSRCGVASGGRASGLESWPLDGPVPPMLA